MNKFNEKSKCVKCGNTTASSEFKKKDFGMIDKKQVIERICNNCGFRWNELPLDHQEANE